MMNRLRRTLSVALLGAVCALPAAAQPDAPTPTALLERLQRLYPATRFGAVHPTLWPGVYEVAMGGHLAYVDASGQYFLFGHLYDMATQRDLTAERKDALTRIDVASLPLADALKAVHGSGARALVVFSDPDCPYCRRLEAELKDLADVTIHTFLMPIVSLHPQSRDKAIAVWCSPDRLAAWHAITARDEPLPTRNCAHPVDRNVGLAERLGITATPTLVAADGRVLAGVATTAQIDVWLSRTTATPDSPASAIGAAR